VLLKAITGPNGKQLGQQQLQYCPALPLEQELQLLHPGGRTYTCKEKRPEIGRFSVEVW
jgi:hypothetical protein